MKNPGPVSVEINTLRAGRGYLPLVRNCPPHLVLPSLYSQEAQIIETDRRRLVPGGQLRRLPLSQHAAATNVRAD